jgi:hypothetical protein
MGPLCSGRPTLVHTASFRASPRVRSRHPLGVAHKLLQSCACPLKRACSRYCYSTHAPRPLRVPLLIPGCSPLPGSCTRCARTRPNTCRLFGSRAPLPRQRSRAPAPAPVAAPAVPPLCLLPRHICSTPTRAAHPRSVPPLASRAPAPPSARAARTRTPLRFRARHASRVLARRLPRRRSGSRVRTRAKPHTHATRAAPSCARASAQAPRC